MSEPHARIHIVTGLLERRGAILLVASKYPNHARPLWNLPGGRQRPGELFDRTLRREFREEVGLDVAVGGLRYVAESYEPGTGTHFLCSAFDVTAAGDPRLDPRDAHVVAYDWVSYADLEGRLEIAVVREPLLTNIADRERRYFGFEDAGIAIEFADPS